MNDLTDNEKRALIDREITLAYPKMYKDFLRITGYNNEQWEDLLPFCISEFLTKKPINYQYQVAVIDKKLLNYMGRSMSLNLKSNSSPFWSQYRKPMYNNRGIYLAETDNNYKDGNYDEVKIPGEMDNFDCMLYHLDKMDFYHKAIITDYFLNEMTYQQLHKKYGITLISLKKAVDAGLASIRNKCKAIL